MKKLPLPKAITAGLVATSFVLSACSSMPEKNVKIETLKDNYELLATQSPVLKYAPVDLKTAEATIAKAEALYEDDEEQASVEHQIYLATKQMEIVKAKTERGLAEERTSEAELRRKQALLDAKEQQLVDAETAAAVYRAQALAAQERASDLEDKAMALSNRVDNLTTKKTDRGVVLTFGDILFETGEAQVKPGAVRTLDRVAEFLKEYPERQIVVEGFTDSVGSEDFNQNLSEERAQSVEAALVDSGVSQARLQAKGFGEAYPVAPNDTREGRQLNRRVELLILNETKNQVSSN
ncbi:OmpA family protein [Halioxenophilus aromaticivorans]|uniref:OmpA family protein n=1 Tax=Halioxenophilus aromaticivorans TaxID=1306992 RepID=A0AAV3U7T8_9ALTE